MPPVLVTTFLWLTGENEISLAQFLIALALLSIPWLSYLRWKKQTREVLPLFAMLAFMYWLYYAVPLFWTDRIISDRSAPLGRELSDTAITAAILMALLGVGALWAGMKVGGRAMKFQGFPSVTLKWSHMNYIRVVLVVCCLLGFSDTLPLALGSGGRQGISILLTGVPALAFVILLRRYLRGEATIVDKLIILFFLTTRVVTGLSSGWLGSFASIIVISAIVYLAELKKMPRLMTMTAVVFVLFFQTGKNDFRKVYWQQEAEPTGRMERVTFWTEASLTKWSEVLTNPSAASIREVLNPSLTRVSLLTQAANVIEMTPSVVPYQYGQLYSYMVITWIPRFIWPDKPSMSEANQFYQIAYSLSSEEELGSVSIAVGVLAEGYISFGWPGAVGIMFLVGIFFELYRRLFLFKSSGFFLVAVGIVLLPSIMAVESQMAAYFGGLVQQVVFTLIVFLPALRMQTLRSRSRADLATTAKVPNLELEAASRP
jgi:hypothetical protein